MNAVEIEGLVKTYPVHRSLRHALRHPLAGPVFRVLDGLDLSVEPGEVLGILGANGAGKTTLLKIIATIVGPTAGTVTVCGQDVVTGRGKIRGLAAYSFTEDRSFYWRLTGRQNLEFFAALDDLQGDEVKRSIASLSERLGLNTYLDDPFSRYSSGIRQRFALARVLLREPRVLLLDEPARSLDPNQAASLWTYIREDLVTRNGVSVLLVTHQLEEAASVCDRVAVLASGRLRADLTVSELRRADNGLEGLCFRFEAFDIGDLARLRRLPGVRDLTLSERDGDKELEVWCENGDSVLSEFIAAAAACGANLRSFERRTSVDQVLTQLLRSGSERDP